ncbi:YkvA family protein [Chloroflexota bacterium]
MMSTIERWKQRVQQLKSETYTIYLASKDPRVPWYAKALIIFVVAHPFSPIDLIPDFIPVIGYLDDLIIAPLGIAIAIKLIPEDVLVECREQAQMVISQEQPSNWSTAAVIVTIWLLLALFSIAIIIRVVGNE